ncbi:hypothetical protein ACSBR1_031934 [Camellia fascicularis]
MKVGRSSFVPVFAMPEDDSAQVDALLYPKGHVSKSIYANATFRLVSAPPTSGSLLGEFLPNLSLAIWTITPWTIPANAAMVLRKLSPALVGNNDVVSFFLYSMHYYCGRNMAYGRNCTDSVAVNSKLQYAVVEVHALLGDASTSPGDRKKRLGNVLKEQNKPFLIIASDLLSTLEAKWGTKLVVKKILKGSDLEHCRYICPIDSRECPVIIGGDYITTESGTGLVHTAPGHEHKYPYDWRRTKKPTIFRATEQWFASVKGFREAAMDAISQVTFLSQVENRIPAMTSCHSDQCISRQRTWGVPIPVFYHVESKELLLNEDTIDHIQSIICQKGSDAWWYMTVDELLPDVYRDKAL